MVWETLPSWFWFIYYLFFFVTFGVASICIGKRKLKTLSLVTMLFVGTIPFLSIANSIGRNENTNEYEHFIIALQAGELWSFYVIIGLLHLFVWWGYVLLQMKR